ncbi:MAG: hypothetical protein HYY40_14725 [Bacteroidetes bacterium]|nr:hypothetical protein [Bacteroidota bacterium]
MKNFWLLISVIFLISSCQPDDDNFTATRDNYLGIWQAELYKNGTADATYDLEILAHPSEASRILIDNFNQIGYGVRAEATVSNTEVDIFQQNVGGYIVSGFGNLKNEGKLLELNYTADDQSGQTPDNMSAILTKK